MNVKSMYIYTHIHTHTHIFNELMAEWWRQAVVDVIAATIFEQQQRANETQERNTKNIYEWAYTQN